MDFSYFDARSFARDTETVTDFFIFTSGPVFASGCAAARGMYTKPLGACRADLTTIALCDGGSLGEGRYTLQRART
jgi:hypothetical protein